MRDPYEILGVPRNASMDEVKKAYRKLSRMYHPDANINNPDKEKAEAKFKEVQAAYKKIVDEKEHGGSSYHNGYGSQGSSQQSYGGFEEFFGGFGGFRGQNQESQESTRIQAAGNYIRNGHYKEAWNVLDSIPVEERTAKWYYYSAMANSGTGNNITAQEHAQRAVQMEPGNYQYEMLLRSLQSGQTWYSQQGTRYGRSMSSPISCCYSCLILHCLCGGGGCFCPCCVPM